MCACQWPRSMTWRMIPTRRCTRKRKEHLPQRDKEHVEKHWSETEIMVERPRRRDKGREAPFGIRAMVECLRSHWADVSEAQGRAKELLNFWKSAYDVKHDGASIIGAPPARGTRSTSRKRDTSRKRKEHLPQEGHGAC